MKKLLTLAALLPLGAWAQAPTITATAPGRNASSVPRTASVGATLSAPATGAADLRVQSTMWHGYRSGTGSGDGTATLRQQPRQVFAPGEAVSVTIPATVRAAAAGAALASGQVLQFRAAAGPGTGSFTAGQSFGSGITGYINPTLADVNNDGWLDYVYGDNSISMFVALGAGGGRFGAAAVAAVGGNSPQSAAVADVNLDGSLDLVTSCTANATGSRVVTVALGNGQGGFALQTTLPTTGVARNLCVGDVNADGYPDLVFQTGPPTALSGQYLTVRLGDDQGGFTARPDLALGTPSYGGPWQLADVNTDGRLDCVFSDGTTARAYLGDGLGGFAPGTATLAAPVLAILADLNGDGRLDAVCADATAGTVKVHAGDGLGGFASTPLATLAQIRATGAVAADVDGDGDLDLLLTYGISTVVTPVPAGPVWLNNGTGTFTAGPTVPGPVNATVVGDINNDGALDAVAVDAYQGTFAVRLNTALATAPTLTSFTPATGSAGTVVTLTGTNFTGATTVLLGGVPVTGFVVVSGTSITFTVPAGSVSGYITVLTPSGQATSATALRLPTATRSSAAWLVALYPNPAQGTATLLVPAVAGATQVQASLYNALGQRVRQYPAVALPATGLHTSLDLGGVSAGIYTLRLTAGETSSSKKLAVE